MAQLYFRYGAMNSGKTIDILKTKHNYEEQFKHVVCLTPVMDTRAGEGIISSRIGLKAEAQIIRPDDTFEDIVSYVIVDGVTPQCVLVDEAQFLSRKNVHELARIVDEYGIPVICYGLKNDFANHLFEGTAELLLFADKIEEIKTICYYPQCNHKAIMNARFIDGHQVTEGEQIMIGDSEYHSVCRRHYFHPPVEG
ncbi:thymidine kinase [Alloscardovia venturai]|uniref:Thymidine kinase n=1 Tax=Alloscardovia venturai TaxID=1769421 RepID=A0ABW2Y6D1_9BIFI